MLRLIPLGVTLVVAFTLSSCIEKVCSEVDAEKRPFIAQLCEGRQA